MQIVNQILQLLQKGLGEVFHLIEAVWRWLSPKSCCAGMARRLAFV